MQVGEVAAVLVGLHHGLGKTEDLLRPSELEKASRVSENDRQQGSKLTQVLGNIRRSDPLHPVTGRCQSFDLVSHDEVIQLEWPESEQSNSLENILLARHHHPCRHGPLGCLVGGSAVGRLQSTTFCRGKCKWISMLSSGMFAARHLGKCRD